MGHYLVVEEPFVRDEAIDLEALEDRFIDTSIQAVVVIPPFSDDSDLMSALMDAGMAFVRVSSDLSTEHRGGGGVGIDDRSAAREMTRYLLGLGHSRIAVIEGPQTHLASRLRLDGYQDAMREAGLIADPALTVSGDFTYRSGLDGATTLLSSPNRPTAIFALNDDMAAGAITSAYRAQLNVPEDLSIVGFDDTANAASLYPPLTTVRQPIRDMAGEAIAALDLTVGNRGTPMNTSYTDYSLIERGSAAPPRLHRSG